MAANAQAPTRRLFLGPPKKKKKHDARVTPCEKKENHLFAAGMGAGEIVGFPRSFITRVNDEKTMRSIRRASFFLRNGANSLDRPEFWNFE